MHRLPEYRYVVVDQPSTTEKIHTIFIYSNCSHNSSSNKHYAIYYIYTMRILLPFLLIQAAAARIKGLVLVNTETGEDVMAMSDQMLIDTSVTGTHLTIRADTGKLNRCVMFDLDHGTLQRTDRDKPFVLAGKKDGTLYDSAALREPGSHTVTARACNDGTVEKLVPGMGTPPTDVDELEPLEQPTEIHVHEPVPISDFVDKIASIVGPIKKKGDGRKLDVDEDAITITFGVTDGLYDLSAGSVTLPSADVQAYNADVYGALTGELKVWHKITLGFSGPIASETGMTIPGSYRAPSTFADYRLDLLFTHTATGKQYFVPGYYSGNGNAANGAVSGNVWLCHFRPDEVGEWTWTAEYAEGTNVAQYGGGNPAGFFNGMSASFVIDASDKIGADLRGKGRLQYVGKHHLQFAGTGEYFMKAGPDSPSNILAYADFDGTTNNGGFGKTYDAHEADFQDGNPTFSNGKGKNLIGAINYLAGKGMNVISVTTLTTDGDDKNVFPFLSHQQDDQLDYDVSKLAQWEVVFDHAEQMGVGLHIKLQDGDSDDVLGSDSLSEVRMLYLREMIARFGHHLAVTWDLGKDVSIIEHIKERSAFIKRLDPYQNPIVVHAAHSVQMTVYSSLLGLNTIDGASLQSAPSDAAKDTFIWLKNSHDAGRPWIVTVDQQDDAATGVLPDGDGNNSDLIRQNVLWGNIIAGGAGVQYYFGLSSTESDLTLQDFRSRDNMWTQTKLALDFLVDNKVPLWDMTSINADREYLVDSTTSTILYHKIAKTSVLNLPGDATRSYSVQWFNPRKGGALQTGTVKAVKGGPKRLIGAPLSLPQKDWVALLRCTNCGD